jgi:hypothetical protein
LSHAKGNFATIILWKIRHVFPRRPFPAKGWKLTQVNGSGKPISQVKSGNLPVSARRYTSSTNARLVANNEPRRRRPREPAKHAQIRRTHLNFGLKIIWTGFKLPRFGPYSRFCRFFGFNSIGMDWTVGGWEFFPDPIQQNH